MIDNNKFASMICLLDKQQAQYLDKDNFLFKYVGEKWIGKRSVWTFDRMACWLEDTTIDNVKKWWCGGELANYKETFFK
jgi:hypothetical protein